MLKTLAQVALVVLVLVLLFVAVMALVQAYAGP